MIWNYFKGKKKRIVLDILFIGIFTLCFFLSEVSLLYVWYPSLLCFVVFFLYLIIDIWRFSKKHNHLKKLLQHIDETAQQLPAASDQLETDYQALVHTLLQTYKRWVKPDRDKNRYVSAGA